MSEKDRIPELFGSMSFNEGTMEQYVPHQAMEVWRDCLKSGKPLPLTAANDIAAGKQRRDSRLHFLVHHDSAFLADF